VFRETYALCCENHTKRTQILSELCMLKQVAHIELLGFKELKKHV
jgi:hypothetical protein